MAVKASGQITLTRINTEYATYVHTKYANSMPIRDSDMYASLTDMTKYVGFAYTSSPEAPSSYTSYTWALIKGDDTREVHSVTQIYYLAPEGVVPDSPTEYIMSDSEDPNIWTGKVPIYIEGYNYWTCLQTVYITKETDSVYDSISNLTLDENGDLQATLSDGTGTIVDVNIDNNGDLHVIFDDTDDYGYIGKILNVGLSDDGELEIEFAANDITWSKAVIHNALNSANANAKEALHNIENLEIGGRNLLLKSNVGGSLQEPSNYLVAQYEITSPYILTYDLEIVDGKTYYESDGEGNYTKVTEPDNTEIGEYYERAADIGLVADQEYVLSMSFTNTNDRKSIVCAVENMSTLEIGEWKEIPYGGIHSYEWKFTATEDMQTAADTFGHINILCSNNEDGGVTDPITGSCLVHWIKLERGNNKTDWTAAPEDITSTFTRVTQTADKINWLVASDASASSVEMTDQAITAIANQIHIKGIVNVEDLAGTSTIINGANIRTGIMVIGGSSDDSSYTPGELTVLADDGEKVIAHFAASGSEIGGFDVTDSYLRSSGGLTALNDTSHTGTFISPSGLLNRNVSGKFVKITDGKLTANDAEISGTLSSPIINGGTITLTDSNLTGDSGHLYIKSGGNTIVSFGGSENKIANFYVQGSSLYTSGKSSRSANVSGVYIGTDAIALGGYSNGHNSFEVLSDGSLYCNNGTFTSNCSINAAAIDSGTIGGARIANGAITAAKIASATITADEIAGSTITAAEIASGTITSAKISASGITADKIKGGTLIVGGDGVTGGITIKNSSGTNIGAIGSAGMITYTGYYGSGGSSIDVFESDANEDNTSTSTEEGSGSDSNGESGTFNPATNIRLIYGSSDGHIGIGNYNNTNGSIYSYLGSKCKFGVYSGTSRDLRFASYYSTDAKGVRFKIPCLSKKGEKGSTAASRTSGGVAVRVGTTGVLYRNTGSSKRYKHDITTNISPENDPHRLYDLPFVQFKYNEDMMSSDDQRYMKDIPGFIAEDVEKYYWMGVELDEDGIPCDWNEKYIIPPMLKLIQEQHEEIEQLKERVKLLEN